MRKALLVISILALTACTDAEMAKVTAIGEAGHIKCFSGGQLIYEGTATGRIQGEQQSDGWFLKDAATGNLVRVSGDCVITN